MASRATYDVSTGRGTSSGTTPLTLVTWAIPPGSSVTVDTVATGRDTATGDTVSRRSLGAAKNVAGVGSLLGSVASLLAVGDAALSTATLTVSTSSGNLVVSVTGVLTKSIDWEVSASIQVN